MNMGSNGHSHLALVEPDEPQAFAEVSLTKPLGDAGLSRFGGILSAEEPVHRLTGVRWLRVVKEMTSNSPIIKGMLFAVEMLIRHAEWVMDQAEGEGVDEAQAKQVADFVESCRTDMRDTWEDTLASVLSFLPYGYSLFEVVYKRRLGEDGDPASGHQDGLIGWDEWAPRSQDSLTRWYFDEHGHALAFEQHAPNQTSPVLIPLDRCLHFVSGSYKGSPEGESVLRSAYVDWDAINKLQLIEAIGAERDLAGLPVALVPTQILRQDRSQQEKAVYDAVKKMVTSVRQNDQAGIVFPLEYNEQGKELYKFELLSTGGQRQFDTGSIIQRRSAQMTMSMLADFLVLGHGKTGTYALSSDKTRLFTTAIGAWLDAIANTINDQAIKPLVRLNGYDPALAPTLRPGPLHEADLDQAGKFFQAMMPLIQTLNRDDQLAIGNYLFDLADWPAITTSPEELPRTEDEEVQDERTEREFERQDAAVTSPGV